MRQLLHAGKTSDRAWAGAVEDAERRPAALGEDAVAALAERVDAEREALPTERARRRCVCITRGRGAVRRRLGLTARGARDLGAVLDHVLGQAEGVLEDVAHEVRDRDAEPV